MECWLTWFSWFSFIFPTTFTFSTLTCIFWSFFSISMCPAACKTASTSIFNNSKVLTDALIWHPAYMKKHISVGLITTFCVLFIENLYTKLIPRLSWTKLRQIFSRKNSIKLSKRWFSVNFVSFSLYINYRLTFSGHNLYNFQRISVF